MNPIDLLIAPAHAAAGAPAGGSMLSALMFPILLIAIMYFLLIRPQMKRNKEHRAMLEKLSVGDEVITGGGVGGRDQEVEQVHRKVRGWKTAGNYATRAAVGARGPDLGTSRRPGLPRGMGRARERSAGGVAATYGVRAW